MDGESLNGRMVPGRPHDDPTPAGQLASGHLPAGQSRDDLDDVDRLFSRMTPLPAPRTFVADVLRAVGPAETAVGLAHPGLRELAWAVASFAALLGVTVLAFLATQAFVAGGALDVLTLALDNADIAADFRGAAILSFVEAFPWIEVLGLLGMLALLAHATHRLSRGLSGGQEDGLRPGGAGPSGLSGPSESGGAHGVRGVA